MTTISAIPTLPSLSSLPPIGGAVPATSAGGFAALLDGVKNGVGGVSDLQRQAADASERLALGESDDVVGTLASVEKADLAFKTLLAVRSKLMAAFDEMRNMPV